MNLRDILRNIASPGASAKPGRSGLEASWRIDASLLFLRLVSGYAMVLHGLVKMQNPTDWMPVAPMPGAFQALNALIELIGGAALISGLCTRTVALAVACAMLRSIFTHVFKMNDPFVAKEVRRSFEREAVYLAITLLLAAVGPGRFSLDRKIFGVKYRSRLLK